MVFDLSKPCIKAIKSTFGGGWVVPLNDYGRLVLSEYYGEPPVDLPAVVGVPKGYIVEPQDAGELAEYLRSEGVAWEVE